MVANPTIKILACLPTTTPTPHHNDNHIDLIFFIGNSQQRHLRQDYFNIAILMIVWKIHQPLHLKHRREDTHHLILINNSIGYMGLIVNSIFLDHLLFNINLFHLDFCQVSRPYLLSQNSNSNNNIFIEVSLLRDNNPQHILKLKKAAKDRRSNTGTSSTSTNYTTTAQATAATAAIAAATNCITTTVTTNWITRSAAATTTAATN